MVLEESSTCVSCLHKQTPFFPFGLRGNYFGIRSSYPGPRRYRPISRPIFLIVRFDSFIHSFQYHSVHQLLLSGSRISTTFLSSLLGDAPVKACHILSPTTCRWPQDRLHPRGSLRQSYTSRANNWKGHGDYRLGNGGLVAGILGVYQSIIRE